LPEIAHTARWVARSVDPETVIRAHVIGYSVQREASGLALLVLPVVSILGVSNTVPMKISDPDDVLLQPRR
jgi:hypothetical protein